MFGRKKKHNQNEHSDFVTEDGEFRLWSDANEALSIIEQQLYGIELRQRRNNDYWRRGVIKHDEFERQNQYLELAKQNHTEYREKLLGQMDALGARALDDVMSEDDKNDDQE